MKTFLSTLILASVFALSFTVHASDLRDVKESQLTTEQKKEVFSKMTDKEIEFLDNYEGTKTYQAVLSNQEIPDLTINEKLKIISTQQKK